LGGLQFKACPGKKLTRYLLSTVTAGHDGIRGIMTEVTSFWMRSTLKADM
jgi:hypothetical protein